VCACLQLEALLEDRGVTKDVFADQDATVILDEAQVRALPMSNVKRNLTLPSCFPCLQVVFGVLTFWLMVKTAKARFICFSRYGESRPTVTQHDSTPTCFASLVDSSILRFSSEDGREFLRKYNEVAQQFRLRLVPVEETLAQLLINVSGGHWGCFTGLIRHLNDQLIGIGRTHAFADSGQQQKDAVKLLMSGYFLQAVLAGECFRVLPTRTLSEPESDFLRKLIDKQTVPYEAKVPLTCQLEQDGFIVKVRGGWQWCAVSLLCEASARCD
jgi:hypothetical protein